MFDIDQVIVALRDSIKDLTDIVGLIRRNVASGIAIRSMLRREREFQKLRKILVGLSRIHMMQQSLPGYLEKVAVHLERGEESPFSNHNYDTHSISVLLEYVLELREFIEVNHPELLSRKPEIFDKVVMGLIKRDEMLTEMKDYSMERNGFLKGVAPEKLRELAKEYKEMIKISTDYRKALANYLEINDKYEKPRVFR